MSWGLYVQTIEVDINTMLVSHKVVGDLTVVSHKVSDLSVHTTIEVNVLNIMHSQYNQPQGAILNCTYYRVRTCCVVYYTKHCMFGDCTVTCYFVQHKHLLLRSAQAPVASFSTSTQQQQDHVLMSVD